MARGGVGGARLSLPHLNLVDVGSCGLAMQSFRALLIQLELLRRLLAAVAAPVHLRQVRAGVHVTTGVASLLRVGERPREVDAHAGSAGDVVGGQLLTAGGVGERVASGFEETDGRREVYGRDFTGVVH